MCCVFVCLCAVPAGVLEVSCVKGVCVVVQVAVWGVCSPFIPPRMLDFYITSQTSAVIAAFRQCCMLFTVRNGDHITFQSVQLQVQESATCLALSFLIQCKNEICDSRVKL